MQDIELSIAGMGEEPPLIADGRAGPPDRREISARWLSGTFLTGLTSSVLMGVALFAALDGREQLATPPEIARIVAVADLGDGRDLHAPFVASFGDGTGRREAVGLGFLAGARLMGDGGDAGDLRRRRKLLAPVKRGEQCDTH
jgi:hypothetical protein